MNIANQLDNALTYLITALLGGVAWLVRRVFTNQKQIELLEADLTFRHRQREEDRKALDEVKDDVKVIRNHLLSRGGGQGG